MDDSTNQKNGTVNRFLSVLICIVCFVSMYGQEYSLGSIPILPAGKTVTITIPAQVKNSLPPGTYEINQQGRITVGNYPGQDFASNSTATFVVGAPPVAPPTCHHLNSGIDADGFCRFTMGEIVPGAHPGELLSVKIESEIGTIVFQQDRLIPQNVVEFDACRWRGQRLKVTVDNGLGTCWSWLTIHEPDGPRFLRGRSITIHCYDPLVLGGDILGIKPVAAIPCYGPAEVNFVADWVNPYECESDTVKVILREYEAFDKTGRRASVMDTIVVVKLPQIVNVDLSANYRNIGCARNDTLYCGENELTDSLTGYTPVGPYLLVEEYPGFPMIDFDMDGSFCDTIWFCAFKDGELISLFDNDNKCGLSVHKEISRFGGICEKQYKVVIELKQTCSRTPQILQCFVPGSDQNVEIISQGYFRCEFWITDMDTVPPSFAPKIFGEFGCITIDTGIIGGSDLDFLDIFQPVVYTKDHECVAESYIPPLCIFDDWSGVKAAKATVEGVGTFILENEGEVCNLFELGDQTIVLEDYLSLFGQEVKEEELDSLIELIESLGLIEQGYCYRSHQKVRLPKSEGPIRVFYEVYDSCHLIGRDTAYIHVKDATPPVAVADKGVTVSLSDKKLWVDAEVFDEGSWDNCGINLLLARRSDWQEACVDLCYNVPDNSDCQSGEKESALCWLWTDGHDTLWMPILEDDKHCDEVEAHYKKQLDWFCEDQSDCGPLLYNSWLYDLIKYATVTCKPHSYLDDHSFHELFKRAVGNPQPGDQVRIKNPDVLTFLDTVAGGIVADSIFMDDFIIDIDSSGGLFDLTYGVDVFKCQDIASILCSPNFFDDFDEFFIYILLQQYLGECLSFFGPDIDLFLPAIFPEPYQNPLFDEWSQIGGGWSDAVPFSCEDACGPVTVEILVMDYWCNWSTAWTTVWVEDKTPIEVAKDVVEEIEITCATYKADQYYYPGQIHALGLDDLVALGKEGDSVALSVIDTILGGYCKAWRDSYGNYVDIDGKEIDCDIYFSDAYCHCEPIDTQIRVYDDHFGYIWKDSTYTKCYYETEDILLQKGVVVVNCGENVYCEQELWCEFDHCGQGYIFRKWKIWSSCADDSEDGANGHIPDTIYRHQRIWVGNECELSKYMFDVPGDVTVTSCALTYDPSGSGQLVGDLSPDITGYPVYKFDDDCRIVGIGHQDKVFKVVGGDAACYKVVRTWYFADWCGGKPVDSYWWYDRGLIIDSCVQKIIVQDTVGPVCTITGPVNSGDTIEVGACAYNFTASVSTSDACGVISYSWVLKQIEDGIATGIDSDQGALSSDTTDAFDISSDGLLPGTYKLVVTTVDECQNEGVCEYDFTLVSAKKPAPVCITLLTATLTPWDTDSDGVIDSAHAVIWASEFNSSSALACEDDSLAFRIEFVDGIDDDTYAEDSASLDLTCENIGTKVVRLWVLSYPSGTADYCDVILMVQSDGDGCDASSSHIPSGKDMAETVEQVEIAPRNENGFSTLDDSIMHSPFVTNNWNLDQSFTLYQNRPNPFRNETIIGFYLPEASNARLTIYDLKGRVIKMYQGTYNKGYSEIEINYQDLRLNGILYYQLDTPKFIGSRKMIVIQ